MKDILTKSIRLFLIVLLNSSKRIDNDTKGVDKFIMAAIELDR
jgi:hypothetical protein